MRYEFKVTAEVERTQGLFASRDEISDQMREAIEGADYGSWTGDNGGEYETIEWEVEEAQSVADQLAPVRRALAGLRQIDPNAEPSKLAAGVNELWKEVNR